MSDSPRRGESEPPRPPGDGYAGYSDPAYAGQTPYGPTYPAPPNPTERMPAYSPYGHDPYSTGQFQPQYGADYPPGGPAAEPPPDGPRAPRWLWIVAAVAVVVVVGLVIALVIANSSKQDTVVAPLPSLNEPTSSRSTPATTTRTTRPNIPLPPITPGTTPPSGSATPGATESVTYEVNGTGRAISITYADSGGVLQTEFNVVLPWSKSVELAEPAADTASITIINVGSEVTCSVSVNGAQVQQTTGNTLTICVGSR